MQEDEERDHLISNVYKASEVWEMTIKALKATQQYQMYYNLYKYLGNGPTLEDKVNDVFMLLPEWAAYQDADKALKQAQEELRVHYLRRSNVFRGGWSVRTWS